MDFQLRKSFGLVKFFPVTARFFRFVMPRMLDFSSYPLYKGKIARLERERQVQIESLNNQVGMQKFHKNILSQLIPPFPFFAELRRVGADRDGGYFIPLIEEAKEPWITIGLGFNCHFENEIAALGSKVDTFDHTIPWSPKSLSKLVKWNKIGWGNEEQENVKTISQIRRVAGHVLSDGWNLKFDIENAEWSLIVQLFEDLNNDSLPNIITCELHELLWKPGCDYKVSVLENLRIHYTPIHLHGNNFSALYAEVDYLIYDALEVTFIRNDLFGRLTPVRTDVVKPAANDSTSPDYEIRLIK
jgi:hypothetical protein